MDIEKKFKRNFYSLHSVIIISIIITVITINIIFISRRVLYAINL